MGKANDGAVVMRIRVELEVEDLNGSGWFFGEAEGRPADSPADVVSALVTGCNQACCRDDDEYPVIVLKDRGANFADVARAEVVSVTEIEEPRDG